MKKGVDGYPGSSNVDRAWHFTSPCCTCDFSRSCFCCSLLGLRPQSFKHNFMHWSVNVSKLVYLLCYFFNRTVLQFTLRYNHWVTLKPKNCQNSFSVHNAITQHKLQLHGWEQGECICVFSLLNLYSTANFPLSNTIQLSCYRILSPTRKFSCRIPCHRAYSG